MSGYPPPPDYNTATGGGYGAPGSKNVPFYNNTGYTQGPDTAQTEMPPFPPPPLHTMPAPEPVGQADPEASSGPFTGSSFSEKAIRRAFIRKVYLILMTQLSVTIAFVCFFIFHEPTKNFIRHGKGVYLYYSAYAVFIVTYITLVCCPSVRRKTPGNYICLAVFTLAFSYMMGTLSCYYDTKIVLIALGITAAVCLSISIFACQTKIDFTLCSGLLFALLMVLFFFGLASTIVYFVSGPNQILNCVYAALGALVFSLFLAYDTQMLLGGRKFQLEPEEYVTGALQLYLDIVYIFMFIMSLAGNSSS